MNNMILRNLSYGVYVVSTMDKARPTGCIANSAMQVTSEPGTIAVSINHLNFTNECIEKSNVFAMSILSENTDPKIIGKFGFSSGKDINKFDEVDYEMIDGLPVLKECCGYILCKVIDKMETSTHTVFLGEIINGDVINDVKEMTYSYYHQVIKGKSPKNAPTYISTEKAEKNSEQYVCGICGYEYDGELSFDQLPEDYVCPICKQPKSVFTKK